MQQQIDAGYGFNPKHEEDIVEEIIQYEKDGLERYRIELLKDIIEDAQQVHPEYIIEQLKQKLKDYECGI